MRVLRGRAGDPATDAERTRELVDSVPATGEAALRVWRPHRQVVFGRRDRRSDGYERARELAGDRGFHVRERDAGGCAVAHTGSTVAFVRAEPVDDHRTGIRSRYDKALATLRTGLDDCGVDARRGEPGDSFCPGSHSLRVDAGKVVGVAQRVRQSVAVVAGLVVVGDPEAVADVLDPVYDALDVPFDPDSVGSLAASGATPTTDGVTRALEAAFADGRETTVTTVRET